MPDNYFKTSDRMYESSKVTHASSQFHNACYLAGYVMECYGKITLSKYNPSTNVRSYLHSQSQINRDLKYILTTASPIKAYALDLSMECARMYNNWDPNKRYNDPTNWDQAMSNDFQLEMGKIWSKIVEMHYDGII